MVRCFTNRGANVIATLGTYPTFKYHVDGYGAILKAIPYNTELKCDLLQLANAAVRYQASIVYLANPDNPTGTFFNREKILRLRKSIPTNCILILDEAYIDFSDSNSKTNILIDSNTVHLRTFSKLYGLAGLRIGYAIANEQILSYCNKVRLQYGINSLAQAAATAALEDNNFVNEVLFKTRLAKKYYYQFANAFGLQTIPSKTNFVCFNLGSPEVTESTVKKLLANGVFVRVAGPTLPLSQHIRITAAPIDQVKEFCHIFKSIYEKVRGYS